MKNFYGFRKQRHRKSAINFSFFSYTVPVRDINVEVSVITPHMEILKTY